MLLSTKNRYVGQYESKRTMRTFTYEIVETPRFNIQLALPCSQTSITQIRQFCSQLTMGEEVNRIGLYCGAVALALSSFMIFGIVANTTPEERRQQELEFRNRKHSCCHNLPIESKCLPACDTHKRPCCGMQNIASSCCCSRHHLRSWIRFTPASVECVVGPWLRISPSMDHKRDARKD